MHEEIAAWKVALDQGRNVADQPHRAAGIASRVHILTNEVAPTGCFEHVPFDEEALDAVDAKRKFRFIRKIHLVLLTKGAGPSHIHARVRMPKPRHISDDD